ncbi:hypothetical protein C2I33_24690 [Ralstonia solanacearum]|nr:hypothetical protein C2I33_24690 [Ralstonia solanacearum]
MPGDYTMELNRTHDASRRSWLDEANIPSTDFPLQNLPAGLRRKPSMRCRSTLLNTAEVTPMRGPLARQSPKQNGMPSRCATRSVMSDIASQTGDSPLPDSATKTWTIRPSFLSR